MSYANTIIREAESRADADRDHNDAIDTLYQAVAKCGNDPDKLADLLISVVGPKVAARVLLDFLQGDSDALNDAVVRWAA